MTIAHKEPLHELITDRHLLEVQGVTLDRSDIHIIGIYSFACVFPTALFWFWPALAGILFLIILFSAQKDIRGKQGWIRSFLLKDTGENIISWFPERIPQQANELPSPEKTLILALGMAAGVVLSFPLQDSH